MLSLPVFPPPVFTNQTKLAKNTRIAKYLLTCRYRARKNLAAMTGIKAAKRRGRAPLKRELRAAVESRLRLGDTKVFELTDKRYGVTAQFVLRHANQGRGKAPYHLCYLDFESGEVNGAICAAGFACDYNCIGADIEPEAMATARICRKCLDMFVGFEGSE